MSAKYLKLGGLNFKWQWAVFYEKDMWSFELQRRYWSPAFKQMSSRRLARSFIRDIKRSPRYRNISMKRRLVQANWNDYNDSFGWNAGRGRA